MKINLHIDPSNPTVITPYINVSNVGDFDDICENGECQEIVAMDVLEYIPYNLLKQSITYWLYKLEHGGELVLGGVNLEPVIKATYRKDINSSQVNELVFGVQDKPCNFKKSSVNLEELKGFVASLGMKILETRLMGFTYILRIQRP